MLIPNLFLIGSTVGLQEGRWQFRKEKKKGSAISPWAQYAILQHAQAYVVPSRHSQNRTLTANCLHNALEPGLCQAALLPPSPSASPRQTRVKDAS